MMILLTCLCPNSFYKNKLISVFLSYFKSSSFSNVSHVICYDVLLKAECYCLRKTVLQEKRFCYSFHSICDLMVSFFCQMIEFKSDL